MRYGALRRVLPRPLLNYILHFEAAAEHAAVEFASALPDGARVLDAGAGEGVYAQFFPRQRYCAVDLGIGDAQWDYRRLDAIADLLALPFRPASFDACINIVTLEHLRDPAAAVAQIACALKPGGVLLLVAPHEWEVHQAPHDYFRFTRYGLRHLLEQSGFYSIHIRPVGGFFRLLARRMFNALQFFPGVWLIPAAILLAPPALALPLLDRLDRDRDFTLGYICTARKPL